MDLKVKSRKESTEKISYTIIGYLGAPYCKAHRRWFIRMSPLKITAVI